MKRPLLGPLCLIITLAVLIWSGVHPKDRLTWFLETTPVFIILPIALYVAKKHRITPLLMILMTLHAAVLCMGAKYTYAEVPLGIWFQDLLALGRNHYDRLGHLAQGFVPAILAREILIRKQVLKKQGWWMGLIVSALCLAFSACYEFIEWFAALATGEAAEAFLGTQGDVWDTQWDMFLALLGSVAAQVFLSKRHRKELERLPA